MRDKSPLYRMNDDTEMLGNSELAEKNYGILSHGQSFSRFCPSPGPVAASNFGKKGTRIL